MRVISGWELHDIGVDETIRIMRERIRPGTPVFVTFDIDFLDAAYAPGTGTPEIGGFTTHEALKLILGVCPGQRLVGMDLVEVLPGYRLRGHHLVRRGGDHARVSGLPRRQQEA